MFGTRLKSSLIGLTIVLALVLAGFVSPAQGDEHSFFLDDVYVGVLFPAPPDFPPAWRSRSVHLSPLIATPDGLAEGDTLALTLFPDKVYTARIDRIAVNVSSTVTIRGRIEGYPLGYLLISTTGDRSLGSIRIPEKGERYIIQSEPYNKTHYLLEVIVHLLDEIEDGPPLIPPPPTPQEAAEMESLRDLVVGSPWDPAQIDVMIIYTPAARQWADISGGGLANVIAQSMEKAQLALDNSNTILTMFLVRSAEVNYTESGDSYTDLDRLTFHAGFDPWNRDPGRYMDEVQAWRDQYAADLVALFAHVDDVGGLGWLLNSSSGRPHYGFSLTRVQQAGWTYTHIHEMGHNMGCHHHKEQTTSPGPGLFGYSAGWRWAGNDGGKYCSIMTYTGGEYFSDGQSHTRVAHFSNPGIFHQGAATGHASNGDNARTIREVKHVVSSYRASTQYRLTIQAGTGGTTDPPPGNYTYDWGASVTVTAIPYDYHIFTGWSGDLSGETNPAEITMSSDKSITASFRLINPPSNSSGQKIQNRSLLLDEYINILKWEANPKNQGINIVKYRIYQVEGNLKNLLVELNSGTFEYWHRKVEKTKPYTYVLAAVAAGDREGQPVYLTIQ